VSFTGGAQAQDKSQSLGEHTRLVGCGTIDGLKSAADSSEYSERK